MYSTDAIVLRVWENGEDDFMASFFTKEFGKIVMIVRGGKKIQTKQGNTLHRFSVVRILFIIGKRYPILRSIMEIKSLHNINDNLYGYGYINSFLLLCDKLLYENTKDVGLWNLLNKSMQDASGIVDKSKNNKDVCDRLWVAEKEWLNSMVDIMGLKEYNEVKDIKKMDSRQKVDLFFKDNLERVFNTPVSFFGLILKENSYGR